METSSSSAAAASDAVEEVPISAGPRRRLAEDRKGEQVDGSCGVRGEEEVEAFLFFA